MSNLYLDESGDLGDLIESPGTSRNFVIAILELKSELARKAFEKAVIRTLRNKLHGKRSQKRDAVTELKAAKTVFAIKQYFYCQVADTPFNIYTAILDKARFVNSQQLSQKRVYQSIMTIRMRINPCRPLTSLPGESIRNTKRETLSGMIYFGRKLFMNKCIRQNKKRVTPEQRFPETVLPT